MRKLLIATRNLGKVREIRGYFADLQLDVLGLDDLPQLPGCVEDGSTFRQNAIKKARHYHELTGLMTLADDSGLVVDALGGLPGVSSARFAGDGASDADRIAKLLDMMRNVPEDLRTARFVCALALYDEGREIFVIEGSCEGRILSCPQGKGGFGYDPIFFVPEIGRTFAELDTKEKNRISHRGKALAEARERLREYLSRGRPLCLP